MVSGTSISPLSPSGSHSALGNDPAAVYANSLKLQKLALMQDIANTVMTGLTNIVNSDSKDRVMQKSMIGNLHQWYSE